MLTGQISYLFLANNFDNTSDSCKFQISRIAKKWLISTTKEFPRRKEAAKIVYKSARLAFESKKTPHNYIPYNVDKECYQALLAAYPELPHEVEDLCLKLVGLCEDDIKPTTQTVDSNDTKTPPPTTFLPRRRIEKTHLLNGPRFKKDNTFKDVCLEGRNFNYLVTFKSTVGI